MAKRKIKSAQTTTLKNNLSEKIPFIRFVYSAIILNFLNISAIFILQKNLPPQVPLFYGLSESEQQLTSSLGLLIPVAY